MPQPVAGHLGFVNSVCFDESGRCLFSASIEGSLCVWDVDSLTPAGQYAIHRGPINDLACHDGVIASAGYDGAVQLTTLEGTPSRRYEAASPVHAVALGDNLVAFGGKSRTLHVARAGAVEQFPGHEDAIECLCVGNGRVLSGSRDGMVRVWNPLAGELDQVLSGHADWVTQVAMVSHDHALSVGEDGLVILWDLTAGQELWRIDLGYPIWGLGVDQGSREAYVGKAGTPVIVDIETRAVSELEGVPGFAARAIDVSPSGLVALGHDGGGICFLQPGHVAPARQIAGQHQGILCAAFDANGCVTGHQNGNVTFYPHRARPLSVRGHEYMAYATVALSNQQVAVGSLDGRISIWDSSARRQTNTLRHNGQVFSLATTSDSSVLLSAGDDHWIQWDTSTWAPLHREEELGSGNHTLASISPDGRLVASAGENARLSVWRDSRLAQEIDLPLQDVSAITVAPDAEHILLAFNDGEVGCANLDNGDYTKLHDVHDSWVRQLIVSGDGKTVLSCSQNGIAAAHELGAGATSLLASGPVAALGFTPAGNIALLSCSGQLREMSR